MKDIKDYLHLYLGCEIEHDKKVYRGTLVSIGFHTAEIHCDFFKKNSHGHRVPKDKDFGTFHIQICRLKPILRPLSDMTEAEVDTVWGLFGWNNRITNFQERMMNILWEFNPPDEEFEPDWRPGRWEYLISALPYLLKQGFDIFGLIEAGLAIDITKLNKEK